MFGLLVIEGSRARFLSDKLTLVWKELEPTEVIGKPQISDHGC